MFFVFTPAFFSFLWHFLFFLLGPPASAVQHLDTLAYVARLMSDEEFRYEAGSARSSQDLLAALNRFIDRTSPKPAAVEAVPRGLTYTGKFAGGLLADVARRWPHYLSDFRDGLHIKCLGSTLFLYFACLAPAVTFGGVTLTPGAWVYADNNGVVVAPRSLTG